MEMGKPYQSTLHPQHHFREMIIRYLLAHHFFEGKIDKAAMKSIKNKVEEICRQRKKGEREEKWKRKDESIRIIWRFQYINNRNLDK